MSTAGEGEVGKSEGPGETVRGRKEARREGGKWGGGEQKMKREERKMRKGQEGEIVLNYWMIREIDNFTYIKYTYVHNITT